MRNSPGDRLGPCEIPGLLGAGARGDAHRAKDVRLETDTRAYPLVIRREIVLAKGDTQGAVRPPCEAVGFPDTRLGRPLLARACLGAHGYADPASDLELRAKRRGEATAIFLDDDPGHRCFPREYFYPGQVQQALDMRSTSESYKTFLDINAKAYRGAPLVNEARRSLGVGTADARASKIGVGPLKR